MGFVSYNVVPPPPTGLFAPPTIDLSNSGLEEFQQPEFKGYRPKASNSVCKYTSNEVKKTLDAPIWLTVINIKGKGCFNEIGLKPLNTARHVNTDHPKTTVYSARPMTCFSKLAQSTVKRPYQLITSLTNKNFNQKVNTAKEKVYTAKPKAVNTTRPTSAVVNAVRANQGHPQKEDQGYVNSGCSRHMTSNMSYLSDFKEFDGGYVTFGGGARGGRITSKGTLKTGKLDFEDVYFVKELQFNLFSVSQMCDKKNSVLFTDTLCFVLSPNFKLPIESQVLLKVPRKNNMYSVDMKNIVPKESLTCLVAKATLDESMLWHRRLGHINFKTINKLVKDNLVRGLPAKHFENDQTCVACLKGKQHKASCKSKIQNSITQPLFMLHMDLFGPTFVSSLMNKKYCLVVTDDYSRFTWVFFLASKDETSGILKNFITEIENLVDKKVKIIRCDNGTEFKNRVMNEFCEKKGIKREFSVARTPQQNGVAERRNRTLIEAARTMLADSKLPTTFWAEAVNTACYVQNRVIIVKPHNKTPYELFRGRTPALSFMRPFGCHVTILNTLDHLGKFDGKSDDGFFVGYSLTSKAFRVYNIRTRKVEENLHIRFLENKPIVTGDGPKWLFDIDSLTKSMNYVPVVAGTNSNDFAGSEESNGAGHTSKETEFSQDYIVMPLWKDGSMFDSSSKNSSDDEPQPSSNAEKKDDEGVSKASGFSDQEQPESSTPNINTVGPSINTASANFKTGSLNINTVSPTVITTRSNRSQNVSDMFSLGRSATLEATHADLFGDETEMDMSNLTTSYQVPTTPNTRIHKDHSLDHMDMKSAFLYGTIEEEVYVCQPPGLEDLDYPYKFYMVVKALYGLHQAPRAWYRTLAKYLLDNRFQRGKIDQTLFIKKQKGDMLLVQVYFDEIIFGSTNKELCTEFEKLMHDKFQISYIGELNFFLDARTASTAMDTEKPLPKDSDGDDVDVHLYKSMIGSLMYLISSRPNIMFVVCACARFQVSPKFSHSHAVKKIFRLISWQCKKKTMVATSSTKAECVATTSCCGQQTASASTSENGEMKITTTIDGRVKTIAEASIRRHVKLEDSDGSQLEDQLGVFSAAKILADVARVHTYSRRRRTVCTGSGGISTAEESVSTTGASMPVSTAGMDQGSIPSPSASKDKATIRLQEQLDEEESQRIAWDAEVAQRLQEEIDTSERQRMAQVHQATQGFTDAEWDDILARVAVDEDLVQQLQAGSGEEQSTEKEKELSEEELQKLMMIVPVEEVYVEALQKFDRDDLEKLWSLVKERLSSTDPTDDKERILWVELKRLFEPNIDDILWKLQRYMHDPLTWRLYNTCGVHHVSTDRGHDIFMLVEKDYPLTRGLMTVMLANKFQMDQSSEMENELLRKFFIQAERPRH
ncbi:putative ribonuclease H-like domain-containing protein [Tanacetum coccineum]